MSFAFGVLNDARFSLQALFANPSRLCLLHTKFIMAKSIAIENKDQLAVLVTSSLCIVIPALAVGLRFIAKAMRGGYDYSDYCIAAALVCA